MNDIRYELLMQIYGLLDEDIGSYVKENGYDYKIEYNEDFCSLWLLFKNRKEIICYYEMNKLLYLILNYKTEKNEMIKKINSLIEEEN